MAEKLISFSHALQQDFGRIVPHFNVIHPLILILEVGIKLLGLEVFALPQLAFRPFLLKQVAQIVNLPR